MSCPDTPANCHVEMLLVIASSQAFEGYGCWQAVACRPWSAMGLQFMPARKNVFSSSPYLPALKNQSLLSSLQDIQSQHFPLFFLSADGFSTHVSKFPKTA